MSNPLTTEEIEQIRRMHAEGHSLREVARQLGRASSTISRTSAKLGLEWDRSQTAAATAAASADNRARRVSIIGRLYDQIDHLLGRLEAPTYTFTTSTVRGIETTVLDEPPAQEVKALVQSISSAASTAARLEAVDADQGTDGAASMVGELTANLRLVVAQLDAQDDEPDSDEDADAGA